MPAEEAAPVVHMDAPFKPGDRVQLAGLQVQTELNGACCTIMSFDEARGQWQVETDDLGMRHAVADFLVPVYNAPNVQLTYAAAAQVVAMEDFEAGALQVQGVSKAKQAHEEEVAFLVAGRQKGALPYRGTGAVGWPAAGSGGL